MGCVAPHTWFSELSKSTWYNFISEVSHSEFLGRRPMYKHNKLNTGIYWKGHPFFCETCFWLYMTAFHKELLPSGYKRLWKLWCGQKLSPLHMQHRCIALASKVQYIPVFYIRFSPSSQGTCICEWKAASGWVAENKGCPCQQGEPLSCHHKMLLGGSSVLASLAGVWKTGR